MNMRRFLVTGLAVSLLSSGVLLAQVKIDPSRKGISTGGVGVEKSAFKGRLPRYFAQLGLHNTQRDMIYGIQSKYYSRLKELEAQLEALKKQRNDEITKVLSTKQTERLAELEKANRERMKKRAAEKQQTRPIPADGGNTKELDKT